MRARGSNAGGAYKALQATAATLCILAVATRHNAVVAEVSALPAAVPELVRRLYGLRMNCFRHPNEVAVVFCKGCAKPLCWACSQQALGNQTHVCSADCARRASLQVDSDDPPETPFQRVYAALYLTILLAILGGGLCVWRAQWAIAWEKEYSQREKEGQPVPEESKLDLPFRVFYYLGITDWRAQFGIGAAVGAGHALAFFAAY